MTILTSSESAKLVHKYIGVLKNATNDSTSNFLLIGEVLALVNQKRLYLQYADHVKTFDGFLVEVGIKRGNAYHALRVWREFGKYDLENIPHDRLIRMLPLRLDENKKATWLHDARELPAFAFNDCLREAKGLPARDNCLHSETMTKIVCKCCAKVLKTD